MIASLVLLIVGAAAFGWVLVDQKKEKQILQEYQETLETKLSPLDKLVGSGADMLLPLADDNDWQQKLVQYNKQKKIEKIVLSASIGCIITGGAIIIYQLLLWIHRIVAKYRVRLKEFSTDILRLKRKSKDEQLNEVSIKEDEKGCESSQKTHMQKKIFEESSKVLVDSPGQSFDKNHINDKLTFSQSSFYNRDNPLLDQSEKDAEKVSMLFCDQKSLELKQKLESDNEYPDANPKPLDQLTKNSHESILSEYQENVLKLEDSLRAQTKDLGKQIAEFRQIAQAIKKTAVEHSKPFDNTLTELIGQVSAIREHSSYQQNRIEKLQDGYDWNIIRTFCLRVIRCIDNLEKRIELLSKQDINTTAIEEIRDELVFTLESSGIEQFEPEIGSDYREQEKYVEVIKEKQHCEDVKQKGKIAKIIRRGYRYVISDENVKVVRAVRVMLFGQLD